MLKAHRTKWLFTPNETDEQMVQQERERLSRPGVTITRADAIRSLFHRGSLAHLEAEMASREMEERAA